MSPGLDGRLTDVSGVEVGHWTGAGTGVTVVLCPPGTVASCEVRGGAPATRETALLAPERTVECVDAVVLAGGSAYGLAAADGVMTWLAERGRGFPTRGGPVPIVPAAAVYDLVPRPGDAAAGDGGPTPPGPRAGRAAADAAVGASGGVGGGPPAIVRGRLGAGTGATVGKWRGVEHAVAGGLGTASARVLDATVAALAVVNAVGDVVDDDGSVLAGSSAPADVVPFPDGTPFDPLESTTLAVVATDARLTKAQCHLVAQSGHHGLARSVRPSHTRHDGDLVVALSTGSAALDAGGFVLDRLRIAAGDVVAAAVRNAVRQT